MLIYQRVTFNYSYLMLYPPSPPLSDHFPWENTGGSPCALQRAAVGPWRWGVPQDDVGQNLWP